jgi:hypothetical protein
MTRWRRMFKPHYIAGVFTVLASIVILAIREPERSGKFPDLKRPAAVIRQSKLKFIEPPPDQHGRPPIETVEVDFCPIQAVRSKRPPNAVCRQSSSKEKDTHFKSSGACAPSH